MSGVVGTRLGPDHVDGVARRPTAEVNRAANADVAVAGVPLWFERGLVVVTAGVVSFGAVGLLFALLGHYGLSVVLALGGLGTVLGSVIAWPRRREAIRPATAATSWPALAMCVVALAFALWNGTHSSEHVLVGRDPGVYTDTGKWIARHGTLRAPAGQQWAGKGSDLTVGASGIYVDTDGTVEFQFDHLTPVLLAEADNIGGDGLLFRVPVLLSSLALCAVYAVGCRFVRRPWLVLAAVAGLAISLPQLNVARETLSESSVELLVWAGIWLLTRAVEQRRFGVGVLAGAALGAMSLSRVDALTYVIPLPFVAAVAFLAYRARGAGRQFARICLAVAVGAVPMIALAMVDLVTYTGHYYSDLHGDVRRLQLGLLASVVAGAVLIGSWSALAPRLDALRTWVHGRRERIGLVCAAVVAAALLVAWFVRPAVQHPRATPVGLIGGLQQASGLPFDPGRNYAEYSMVWIGWYLGPITVALAIIGAALVVARMWRTRRPIDFVVLAVTGMGAALYLWNPLIVPDQIWAMRRFVPAVLPLFVLLAAVCLEAAAAVALRVWRRSATQSAIALGTVGALVLFPLTVTRPVAGFRPQAARLDMVKAVCRQTGPRAALVFVAGDPMARGAVSALRSWCDVPVASLTQPASAQRLTQLADAWASEGRALWVLASAPGKIPPDPGGAGPRVLTSGTSVRDLELAVQRPPQHYASGSIVIYGEQVGR